MKGPIFIMKQTFFSTIFLSLFIFLTACSGGGSSKAEPSVCTNGGTDYPACFAPVCDNGGTNYPTCTAPVCENGADDYPSCTAQVCENGADDYPTCTLPFCSISGVEHPNCIDASLPEFLQESDFYNDTSAAIPVERQITFSHTVLNDSSSLQTVIDDLTDLGGGIITIPAGNWYLGDIRLKSNVHLFIEPDAVIIPQCATSQCPIFMLGYTGAPLISNVSIRSTSITEKFTIDLSSLNDDLYSPELDPPRVGPFSVKHVDNFMISNAYIIDKGTIHASVNLVPRRTNGIWAGASNGVVKDVTVINAHGGYGAVQVRVGEHVLFKNIVSLGGGSTLRIETDAVSASGGQAPLEVSVIAEIFGYNIGCKNGNSAVMIQPWGATNGRFDVQKITADSCGAAVRIDRAFVDWQIPSGQFNNPNNLPVGSFDPNSRITDVNTIYGTNAQVKQGTLPFIPCELRHLWLDDVIPYMETFHQGPSISPLLYAASSTSIEDSRFYDVLVPSEQELHDKSVGFPSASKTISRDDEKIFSCN
jgi:hypothetical protein